VGLITGERDPARAEVQRDRFALVQACKIRSRLWVQSAPAANLPTAATFLEAIAWLDGGLGNRRAFAQAYPAGRVAETGAPSATDWSKVLLQEAGRRLSHRETKHSGLMQLQGITVRWPRSAAASEADRLLTAYNAREAVTWQDVVRTDQQLFAYRRAKAFEGYLRDALGNKEKDRKAQLIREAIENWQKVETLGKENKLGKQAAIQTKKMRGLLERQGG
jgi:hypothetical protein